MSHTKVNLIGEPKSFTLAPSNSQHGSFSSLPIMKMKKRQNACEYSTTRQRQQEETAAAAASNNMVILPSEARRGSTTSAVTSDCQISNRRNLRRNSVHQTEDISAEHQIIISSTTTTTTNQHQQQQQQPLAGKVLEYFKIIHETRWESVDPKTPSLWFCFGGVITHDAILSTSTLSERNSQHP